MMPANEQSTSPPRSTSQVLLEELLKVFDPLKNPADLLGRLIVSAGLSASVEELEREMETIQTAAGQLPQGDISGAIDQATQSLNDLYQSIRRLTQPPFAADFSRTLVDYLVADYLRVHQAGFYHLAVLFGWIRFHQDSLDGDFDPAAPVYAARPVRWEDTPAFFTDTAQQFSQADHGWNTDRFAGNYFILLYHLGQWLDVQHHRFEFPMSESGIKWGEEELRLNLLSASAEGGDGEISTDFGFLIQYLAKGKGGLQAGPKGSVEANIEVPLPGKNVSGSAAANPVDLTYLLNTRVDVSGGFSIQVLPQQVRLLPEAGAQRAELLNGLRVDKSGGRINLMVSADGNRLDLRSFTARAGTRIATGEALEFLAEMHLQEGRILIKKTGNDGFLNALLPQEGIVALFDLFLGWSSEQGIYFGGSAGLEIKLPAHIELGPLEIQGISLGIKPQAGPEQEPGFDVPLGLDVQLLLGPFTAVVQDMGIRALVSYREAGGNLGPLDLDIDFKPPKGIGLSLEMPTVQGGGYLFFDFDKGEYAGAAELTIKQTVSVKAIGILNTKKPDGSPGFSFLLLITAEFKPIQLGYGFTLNGVGGLIAINRGMNLEALAEGVRTNAIDAVMFPDDPVGQAPRIIADLNQFFPVAEGRYSFGLMGILGWGTPTLIEVELGLMIQVPDPVVLAILGVVRMELPDKAAPVISLKADFIGAIDFERQYMFFFAALYDSRLQQYQLEGEMYFTISWGERSNFLFTVGGFHPAFRAPALPNLSGPLKRITLNLLPTDNPRLTLKAYFAVTPNTVQFGASVDFYFKVSEFRVVGYLYLDALFRFNPFFFTVEIGAGLSVMRGGDELLGIHLKGSLSGPTPWHIQGKASFRILVVKTKVKVSKRFGKRQRQILPPRPVLPDLVEALRDLRNWQAELPRFAEQQVAFRELPEDELVLHPAGVLSIRQNRMPLEFHFQKVGNQRPADYGFFRIAIDQYPAEGVALVRDNFAPAEFLRLSNSQRLSRNAFERLPAGLLVQGGDAFHASGEYVGRDYTFEQLILDDPDFATQHPGEGLRMEQDEYEGFVRANAVAQSPQGRRNALAQSQTGARVRQRQAAFVLARRADLEPLKQQGNRLVFGSEAEALQSLRVLEQSAPQLSGRYQVLPIHEIETA